MKLTKREARKRFDAGETVYVYAKWMTEGHDKPIPMRKYDDECTFDGAYASKTTIANGIYLSDMPHYDGW